MNDVSPAVLAAAVSGCLRIHILQGVNVILPHTDLDIVYLFCASKHRIIRQTLDWIWIDCKRYSWRWIMHLQKEVQRNVEF
jgi:hypothetical protein